MRENASCEKNDECCCNSKNNWYLCKSTNVAK